MSIAENHGGLYQNLRLLRETNGQAECNLFKAMGLEYIYVNQGNDTTDLVNAFRKVKDTKKPVVVHINTLKGKGYAPAEEHKENWHYSGPFDIETGAPLYAEEDAYAVVTRDYLLKKMKEDPTVVAITSGTPTVMGFTEDKRKEAGRQFVDVGIAEETAVALASGIAANGGKPLYGVYSTFVQRTFDQISQDLCIDNHPATIVTFWGSVFGMNDVTHLGLQDIPMLGNIPNLVYLAPTTKEEYLAMLDWSMEQQAAALLKEKTGVQPTVINPYYITGVDEELLAQLKEKHSVVITLEDGILDGGFGEKIARFYGSSDVKVLNYGVKKEFLDRYNVEEVLKANHLTAEQIAEDVSALL